MQFLMTFSFLKKGYKVIRGTPEKLMSQLVDEDVTVDPNFDEDFLLTHRTFVPSSQVMEFLLRMMNESRSKDRVSSSKTTQLFLTASLCTVLKVSYLLYVLWNVVCTFGSQTSNLSKYG